MDAPELAEDGGLQIRRYGRVQLTLRYGSGTKAGRSAFEQANSSLGELKLMLSNRSDCVAQGVVKFFRDLPCLSHHRVVAGKLSKAEGFGARAAFADEARPHGVVQLRELIFMCTHPEELIPRVCGVNSRQGSFPHNRALLMRLAWSRNLKEQAAHRFSPSATAGETRQVPIAPLSVCFGYGQTTA